MRMSSHDKQTCKSNPLSAIFNMACMHRGDPLSDLLLSMYPKGLVLAGVLVLFIF